MGCIPSSLIASAVFGSGGDYSTARPCRSNAARTGRRIVRAEAQSVRRV
jgi:hypothetical protein